MLQQHNNESFYESSQGVSTYDYGIVVKTTDELILQAQQIVKNTFGANINLDPSTPQGFLVQQIADALVERQNEILTCYNNLNPNIAAGQFLDSIANFNQIERKIATQSTAVLNITGLSSTVIPAKSQVLNVNGDIFYNKVDIIIPSTGAISSTFYSEAYGEIPIVGIDRIYSTVNGWDTVENKLDIYEHPIGTVGIITENDYSFRIRRENSVNLSASGSYPAIQSGLSALSGITNVIMFQNIEDVELTIPNMPEDFKLKPNAIFSVLDYDDNEDIKNNIATVFYEKKSGGCVLQNYSTGAQSQNKEIPSCPIPFIAKWNKADRIGTEVRVTLSQAYKDAGKYPASRTQTLEQIVQDIIYNNFKSGVNVSIGEKIYPSLFIEILAENGIAYIIKVEIAYKLDTPEFTTDGLNYYNNQIAYIENKEDILVVYA